jgi:riboflavin kinase/FMN adenylyltransferase
VIGSPSPLWQGEPVQPAIRFDGLDSIPSDWGRSVVCIGVFDGVHQGHRAIVRATRDLAAEVSGHVVAVTFDPHPSAVVRPDTQPRMLSTLDHRVALLHEAGADAVLVLTFTPDLASWTPVEFVDRVLVDGLHTVGVVVGEGFRFGHRAAGDVALLTSLGETHGFVVEPLSLQVGSVVEHGDAGHVTWSSTFVRQCVLEGDVAEAARALDRPHRVEGQVVHGDHRGRELGYPTANLDPVDHAAVPADGVYAGWLVRGPTGPAEVALPAAISIGTNPTFEGRDRRIEAYVLDRTDLDLYGEHVAFDFAQRLRPTLAFDGVEPLLDQMAVDVDQARAVTEVSDA